MLIVTFIFILFSQILCLVILFNTDNNYNPTIFRELIFLIVLDQFNRFKDKDELKLTGIVEDKATVFEESVIEVSKQLIKGL